jgi:YegS/Rv2252/BmrU family lipid kinase
VPAENLVIVNPHSGAGTTRRRWKAIEPKLRDALGDLEVEHTRGPRDAERIAREAVRAGVSRLVVAGGDGTTSEVVSGVLGAGLGKQAQIAALPLGTGGDLARSLGTARDLDGAIEGLRNGVSRRVDAGRIRHLGRDGEPTTSYFVNVASFGLSGLVDELVNSASKRMGGTLSFLVGTLRGFLRHRPPEVRLLLDGECIHEGRLTLAAAANGRCFGGGMQIAPRADMGSGQLEVVVIDAMPKPALVRHLPSVYRGTHEQNPHVGMFRGSSLQAEAEPGSVLLDVDGEALGSLPAEIELLPGAIGLFGLPPAPAPGED